MDEAAKQVYAKLSDRKRIEKRLNKLRQIINTSRLEVAQQHMLPEVSIETIQEFDQLIKDNIKHSDVADLVESITESSKAALLGKLSKTPLSVMLDDPLLQSDTYQRIITKFYACLRYEMYQAIKEHTKNNSEEDCIIADDVILEIAQNVNPTHLYTEIFKLYEAEFIYDVDLAVKKMEYVFTHQEPIDDEFVGYIECLTEAHNQMLFQIQDPANKFKAMEVNPI